MLKNLRDWMVVDGITVPIVTGMGTIATQVSNFWEKSDFFGQQQKIFGQNQNCLSSYRKNLGKIKNTK